MHRFYLPPGPCLADTLLLTGAEAHHALDVLRVRRGDEVIVLNGAGAEYECEAQDSARDSLTLTILHKQQHPSPACRITLLQALPKGKLIETIIEKATELGASRIVPLLTERVVVRMDAREAQRKRAKWQAVAIEAIKQCGAPYLPELVPPLSLNDFLGRKEKFELALAGSLQPGSKHPREYFEAFRATHGRNPQSACVCIGPEGDFSPAEYAAIAESGGQPITLGPLVLRTDTAACYCLSILSYEFTAARR